METSNRKPIIGVMGPGESATSEHTAAAFALGQLIAEAGWIVLSGGRNSGVMDAVNKGAKSAGGLTIGILPTADRMNIWRGSGYPDSHRYGPGTQQHQRASPAMPLLRVAWGLAPPRKSRWLSKPRRPSYCSTAQP